MTIPKLEGLNDLRKIASKFEEKIYVTTTSQPDYMRRIAVEMHAMENRPNAVGPATMSSNTPGSGHIMDASGPYDSFSKNSDVDEEAEEDTIVTNGQFSGRCWGRQVLFWQ